MAKRPTPRPRRKARPTVAKAPARRTAQAARATAQPAAKTARVARVARLARAKAIPPTAQRRPKRTPRREPESLRLLELSVGMTVDDLQRSIRFYVDGLGFTVKERWERDGVLRGVMLVAGACEIALGQDDWAKGRDRAKGVAIRVYAETGQDIDALARRMSKAGIALDGPKTASWGARTVSVADPDGFRITFHER